MREIMYICIQYKCVHIYIYNFTYIGAFYLEEITKTYERNYRRKGLMEERVVGGPIVQVYIHIYIFIYIYVCI
jgi:hypothetical protein